MQGLYIHTPFCKSRCSYCAFFSTTRLETASQYIRCLCREMELRGAADISTVYIGGGTPSTLTAQQLHQLFSYINKVYRVGKNAEITLECNPDDVTPEFANVITMLPVNRVSMGVQTFCDDRLRFLHRRHNADQVSAAMDYLHNAGISNISIDLIYGFPGQTLQDWLSDVDHALQLGPQHLSAYALTFEEGTALHRLLEQGKIAEADEELSRSMYYSTIDRLVSHGYEHYEISNFALPGFRSRHNSSYWDHTPYIGLGAAAHSYDGKRIRQWNPACLDTYMDGIEAGKPVVEFEVLDDDSYYNDLLMNSLRTSKGLILDKLDDSHRKFCISQAQPYFTSNLLQLQDCHLQLTRAGLFVSNMIIKDLMFV